MTGVPLIIAFVAAVALMILLISRLKVHPFLAIMGISLLLAIAAGIPLTEIPGVIGAGFSGTFTSIGIVIILGAFIGSVLEKTGAALKLADMVIRLVGEKNPQLAIELMGWVVSIPVFCDSGFVILNPIRKALVKRTGASSVAMTVCLSCGLYISHVFIPPTPGPIAAAQTLGAGDYLLLVIGIGVLCSVFPLIAGLVYAKYIGKKIRSADETVDNGEVVKTYEELKAEFGRLPGGWNAVAPLVVPILLMGLSSVSSMAGWTGWIADGLAFLGTPVMALAAGTVLAVIQLFTSGRQGEFYDMTNDTLKTVGPILFVTAAGGVRRARQGHLFLRYGELHHAACEYAAGDRDLLPLPAGGGSEERAGFLHGRDHDDGGHRGAAAPGARFYRACGRCPGGHGHRRRRHDGQPRQRFLLLGRDELRRNEDGGRLQEPYADDPGYRHRGDD